MTHPLLAFFAAALTALALTACLRPAPDALPELCNAIDDDLDDRVDESACPHAEAVCADDTCRLECDTTHGDADGRYHTGCECPLGNAGVEACNAHDDDCDGATDEAIVGDITNRQQGICAGSTLICDAGGEWSEPSYAAIAHFENDEATCEGLDNDCDGRVDEDTARGLGEQCVAGLGQCRVEGIRVCDPTAPQGPAVCDAIAADIARSEVCNGEDDDCDGSSDEGLIIDAPCETGLPGACHAGRRTCADGAVQCRPATSASGEVCNGIDDDCDGVADEEPDGTICPAFGDNAGSGERACRDARCVIAHCNPGRIDLDGGLAGEADGYRNGCETGCTPSLDEIDVCVGGQPPGCIDNCDGDDDDCDGVVDEGREVPTATRLGVCDDIPWVCDGGWSEPNYADAVAEYEANEVTCDGLDNDCDGPIDEGIFACDSNCDGIDDDEDGRVDEVRACAETTCAADTLQPPCNGCPAGTVIPGPDPIGGAWVCVPAGEFILGSPDDEDGRNNDEGPRVPVAITRPLLVQTHEVTQAQWRAAFDNNPSPFDDCGDDCAVETVNWFEAVAYVNRLSTEAGLGPCYRLVDCAGEPGEGMTCDPEVDRAPTDCDGYRLPTEAEWEYLARGGTQTRFWSGDTEQDLARVGWYRNNSNSNPHPVCTLPVAAPHHPWGLCDVHGSVWEWTESWYGAYPAPPADGAPLADPLGPPRGVWRVFRGGSFDVFARGVRAAYRFTRLPGLRGGYLGFRPVRFAGPPPRAR